MRKLRKRKANLKDQICGEEEQLKDLSDPPDPAKVKRLSKLGLAILKNATANQPEAIFEKSYA